MANLAGTRFLHQKQAFNNHEMPFKKDFSVFISLADTLIWPLQICKALHNQLCFFVLKICTDTYKIIDKNIPLLTIRLGGKPCERDLEGGWGGTGWGSFFGWSGGERAVEDGGGESLGSGATRTWPPPWPPRELPPPKGWSRKAEVKTLLVFGEIVKLPGLSKKAKGRGVPLLTHLVGLGLAVLRVVFLVRLCLGVLLRLLGLLVLLLVVHSLFFLFRFRHKQWACWASTNALPPPSNTTSFSLSPSPPSSPLVPAWAGPVSGERRGKRCGNCYAWIQQHYRSIYDSLEPVFSQYFWMFMRTLVHERINVPEKKLLSIKTQRANNLLH